MRAITVPRPGGSAALVVAELEDPVPADDEVLIEVAAAGVNRSDVGQREGHYPPPPGAPSWPGLEVSGTVQAVGANVTEWAQGDRVCALLPGGGYASLAVAHRGQVLPVPSTIDLVDAAALPEAIATVWSNVFMLAGLRAGETLLLHGGSSGIGTTAIQLARAMGSLVAVTAGSADKLAACERLGASILIDYRREDFVERVLDATDGRGADVVLDAIGGDYLQRDLGALAVGGRIVLIGNQSGAAASFDPGLAMRKWASIHATMLRARPVAEKTEIIASVRENVWPMLEAGQFHPVIDSRIPLAEAALARDRLESSEHIGKILLVP
jgi:putative PIG3 family NAD(P)H quinone oxidoreductase